MREVGLVYYEEEVLGAISYLIEKKSEALGKDEPEWSQQVKKFFYRTGKKVLEATSLRLGPVDVTIREILSQGKEPSLFADPEKLGVYREEISPPADAATFIEACDQGLMPDYHLVLLHGSALRKLQLRPSRPGLLPNIILNEGEFFCYLEGEKDALLGQECSIGMLIAIKHFTEVEYERDFIPCYFKKPFPISTSFLSPVEILGLVYSSAKAFTQRNIAQAGELKQKGPINKGILTIGVWGLTPGTHCPWWNEAGISGPYKDPAMQLELSFNRFLDPRKPSGEPPYFVYSHTRLPTEV